MRDLLQDLQDLRLILRVKLKLKTRFWRYNLEGNMKKIPMRTCIGCNNAKPKKELIRIVKSSDGEVSIDFTGKKNGRGAYVCRDISCLEMAIKTKRLSRAFEMPIENEVYEKLKVEIESESDN